MIGVRTCQWMLIDHVLTFSRKTSTLDDSDAPAEPRRDRKAFACKHASGQRVEEDHTEEAHLDQ